MSKTISFHLQKGGVGKTTISGTISCQSAMQGAKTILVDLDPQGNASSWFLIDKTKYEVSDVLQGRCFIHEAVVPVRSMKNLYILPSFGIGGDLKKYGEQVIKSEPYVIFDLVKQLSKEYDHIVLDLSPGLGNLETSALIASDEIITPMTPEIFSLDGLEIFIHELEGIKKRFNSSVVHNKVIINSFDGRIEQHKDILRVALKGEYSIYKIAVDPVFRKSQESHTAPQLFKMRGKGLKKQTLRSITEISQNIWS
ncbi:MAG: AAA family ATPase [Sphaerochaetaceae bacterium]|nr:AAA family ATPase [Sphaerochaetaceae bacterium]